MSPEGAQDRTGAGDVRSQGDEFSMENCHSSGVGGLIAQSF